MPKDSKVWTDERVEELKKLWKEGLTASQIAKRLGLAEFNFPDGGRSALLGKVHRLNLSTREEKPRIPREYTKREAPTKPTAPSTELVAKVKETVWQKPKVTEKLPEPEPLMLDEGGRVTILHLSDKTCKWPIGDPGKEDFCFCGRTPRDKSPYCEYHARSAFQPMQDRRHRKFA